jgi:hypothetical protein
LEEDVVFTCGGGEDGDATRAWMMRFDMCDCDFGVCADGPDRELCVLRGWYAGTRRCGSLRPLSLKCARKRFLHSAEIVPRAPLKLMSLIIRFTNHNP